MNLALPPYQWYENAKGERWLPPRTAGVDPATAVPPAGFVYMVGRYPNLVVGNRYRLDDATMKPAALLATESLTWSPEIVLRMATTQRRGPRGDGAPVLMSLTHAILVVAVACERCLNALAWKYGVVQPDGQHAGYPEDSREYQESRTRCELCDDALRPREGLIVTGSEATATAKLEGGIAAESTATHHHKPGPLIQ